MPGNPTLCDLPPDPSFGQSVGEPHRSAPFLTLSLSLSLSSLRYIFTVTQSLCAAPPLSPHLSGRRPSPLVGRMIHCELGLKVHCDVGSITDDWCNLRREMEGKAERKLPSDLGCHVKCCSGTWHLDLDCGRSAVYHQK